MKRLLCFLNLLLGIVTVNAQSIAEIEAQADKWAGNLIDYPKALNAYLQCMKQTKDKETHLRLIAKAHKIQEDKNCQLFDECVHLIDSIIYIAAPELTNECQHYLSLIERRVLLTFYDKKNIETKIKLCKKAFEIRRDNKILYGAEYEQLLYWYIDNTTFEEEIPTTEIIDFCTNLCDIQKVNSPQIDSLYISMLNYRAGVCFSKKKDYKTATNLYERNRELIERKKGKTCKEYIEVLSFLCLSYSNLYNELYGNNCYDLRPEKEKELNHKYELFQQKILLNLEIYDFEFSTFLGDIEKYKKDSKETIRTATQLKNLLQQKKSGKSKQYCNLLDDIIEEYSTYTTSATYLFMDLIQQRTDKKIDYSEAAHIIIDPIDYFNDSIVARSIAIEYKTLLDKKYGKENAAYCKALNMEIGTYKKNYADAIPLLEELLALQEKVLGKESLDYELTQVLLTNALSENHQKQEAIAIQLSNINEEDTYSLFYSASLQSEYGKYREAIKIYEEILERCALNPQEAEISFNSITSLAVLCYLELNDTAGLLEFGAKWSTDNRLDKIRRKYILGQIIDWVVVTNKSANEIINFTDNYLLPLTEGTEYLEYKVNIYLAKKQPQKAEETCRQLIQLSNNNNSDIQTIIKCEQYLEFCLMANGELDKAFEQNKIIHSKIVQLPDYRNSIEYYRLRCCEIIHQDIKNNFDEVLRIYTEIANFNYLKHYTTLTDNEVSSLLKAHAGSEIHTAYIEKQIYRALYNKKQIDDADKLINKDLPDRIASIKFGLANMEKSSATITTDILTNFALLSDKDSLIIKAFDYTLLQKQSLLTSEIIKNLQIANSSNKELVEKNKTLQSLRLAIQKNKANGLPTDELDEQALVLHTQLIEDSKFYGDFTRSLNLTWKDIRESLKPDEIAIEFIDYTSLEDNNRHIAALILRSNWDAPKAIELFSEQQIPENIYDYTDFSKLCWEPICKYLDNVKSIYFAPDGALYNIGIESLLTPDGIGYMADKYNLYRVSSTRNLVMRPEKNRMAKLKSIIYGGIDYTTASSTELAEQATDNIETIHNIRGAISSISYLPGTKIEAENIATILNVNKKYDEAILLTGSMGTEQSFRAISGKGIDVAHIATHGFYYKDDNKEQNSYTQTEDNTLTRSGLLFAGSENTIFSDSTYLSDNDGILTALEISTLDLSSLDIITLGACMTAQGDITSDGVFGMQRGFKKAGVNSILMSLWSVDDNATSMLMTEFYKNWINGKSKHDALESAKQSVRSQKEKGWDDPHYWAAFILLDGLD